MGASKTDQRTAAPTEIHSGFELIIRHPFQKVNSSITTSQKIYTNVIEKKSNHQLVWCRLLTPSRSIAWLKHIEASTWCLLAHFVGQTTTQNIHNRSALGRPLEAWQLGKLERLHPARSQPHMAMGWKTQHNWSCEILRCRTNLLNCTSKYLVYRAFSCFLLEGIPFKSCILIVANGREMGYTVCFCGKHEQWLWGNPLVQTFAHHGWIWMESWHHLTKTTINFRIARGKNMTLSCYK